MNLGLLSRRFPVCLSQEARKRENKRTSTFLASDAIVCETSLILAVHEVRRKQKQKRLIFSVHDGTIFSAK